MVTFTKQQTSTAELDYVEGVCLSSDTKPTTGIANGSLVLEMDTGKIYAFNEAGSAWVELA